MRFILALAFATGLVFGIAHAQAVGCDSPESHALDFWIGDWTLSHLQQGKRVESRNHVTKVLDGCAVLEEFHGAPGTALEGRSSSVYDATTREWRQTWVDNQGSYLEFHGGLVDGRMILRREFERGGKKIQQRMVFEDITRDSLRWLWQRSDDGGATWSTNWDIAYRRSGAS